MKQVLFIISFVLLGITLFGQQPEYPDSGFTNKAEAKNLIINGLKEGKWRININTTSKDTNDAKYVLSVYKAGSWIGVVRWYYDNDKIEGKENYSNGHKNGLFRQYYKNGKLMSEIQYNNDTLSGVRKQYSESGKLMEETTYTNDEENGISKIYYENGMLHLETMWKDGQRVYSKCYDMSGNEIK